MTIHLINPRNDRQKRNAKSILNHVCDVIENLEGPIAGYAVFAWDDSGYTSFRVKSGGPVNIDALPAHIFSQATSIHTRVRGEVTYAD